MSDWSPAGDRYDTMTYNRCGRSGLKLPALSLGLWHNFGGVTDADTARAMVLKAFDLGITHFDLANDYGPPSGSAERNLGRILASDLGPYRDELFISTKAGYAMWPGPYGDGGSRKYLVASLDQSLKRMGLDYVDLFYHHRPDPETPIEESMAALDYVVRSGRAQYAGISSYDPEQTRRAVQVLRELGTPCLIHQPCYNMFNREIENGLTKVLEEEGVGCIPFCPLAQGLLTSKYLDGIPEDSRAAKAHGFLSESEVTQERAAMARKLNALAEGRNQSLAQMAIAWVLRQPSVVSALIGASRVSQIEDVVGVLQNPTLSAAELDEIDRVLSGE